MEDYNDFAVYVTDGEYSGFVSCIGRDYPFGKVVGVACRRNLKYALRLNAEECADVSEWMNANNKSYWVFKW